MPRIGIIRHGQKENDALTAKGVLQLETISQVLLKCGFSPDKLLFSPTNRTKQCADISNKLFRLSKIAIEKNLELSPEVPIIEALSSEEAFGQEMQIIMSHGGTVADAIRYGKYPPLGQEKLRRFLLSLTASSILCFSHACYSTLGVTSNLIPYCAPEASCIIYDVQGEIINVEKFITL